MVIEVKVPALPESVSDATIAAIHKKVGDKVTRDEPLLDLETDKVVLEVPSPVTGVLKAVHFQVGDTVTAQQLLAVIEEGAAEAAVPKPASESAAVDQAAVSPGVRRLMAEHGLEPNQIKGSGKEGRITKEDVEHFIQSARERKATQQPTAPQEKQVVAPQSTMARESRRVPMSRLRATIAQRLVQAQHQAAMLTTFNEVNMQAIMDLRNTYKDSFEKKHGQRLGFMSFFTKAVAESLKRFPSVNASIDGNEVVYHGFYDIGVAVSTERGLVVPIVKDADQLTFAQIEHQIQDSAVRARAGKLALEEMQGGTFTITNGGVFGSLLATPILNPPQTAILGMHKIQERPIAENGQVVIRPMMYVALSYDHRLIDGKESVQFLVSVKTLLEDPMRLLLDV
ncbi:MAG: 2-oxoglutarate dehydrogenase complex dihydrolipoyllysine-residue succinyltransferase [Gammaproteobacteria bacterium]|nr:2-oxoglutarate dehydrogenase complex dihydrolipoyllysine-residue succinyltransferase [Gammaproteobacteria bacterium]